MTLFFYADMIGVIAFAISGFLVGARKKLDVFGVALLTFVSALGGGVIRDMVLGQPPTSFVSLAPSAVVFVVLILAFVFRARVEDIEQKHIFVISDSIGLVSFSLSGAMAGLEAGFNLFGVIAMALITAIGGGVIRDILINRVPQILRREVYATISILIAVILSVLHGQNAINLYSILILSILSFGFRLVVFYKDYHLPKI